MENHNETDIYSASWVDIIPTVIHRYSGADYNFFHLCPEKYAAMKMAYLKKFCQTNWMFMVWRFLHILVKLVKVKSVWQKDFDEFQSNLSKQNQLSRFDNFDKFSPF